jgi:hypothetical protein
MKRAALIMLVASICVGVSALSGSAGASVGPIPDFVIPGTTDFYLKECSKLPEARKRTCYIRKLLAEVEKTNDPARALPRIDEKVHRNGGYLESNCHIFMHAVGRTWARRHGVTFENIRRYVPKSNDPGCSAGFGMGLVMHLGAQIVLNPRRALRSCTRLPTRFREYTCIHGAGHALMRGYHGQLAGAVLACTKLGPRFAPDCAQGAFHDYWISLSGGDGTRRPQEADEDPKSVCGRFTFLRPCWYRYFWERQGYEFVGGVDGLLRLCGDYSGLQRAGCMGGASLLMARERESADHALICSRLNPTDSLDCLRGVNVPVVATNKFEQLRLFRTCAKFPQHARHRCYAWFGKTLTVVTDGRFGRSACPKLNVPDVRAACVVGARRADEALVTFS